MKRFVDEKKTSARVRFLMQDVIELRQNGWRKRREDAGPKTIDQIHKEVEKEQMEMKIAHMTASLGSAPSNRRQDERRYDRTDDRRRSTKGPGPGQSGTTEDGWQAVPTRAARVTTEKIDTNRLRNIGSSKVDADQMSFGPPRGGGGSFGAWGRGSQSGKSSKQEQVTLLQGKRNIPRGLYSSTQTRIDSHSWTRRRLALLLTMTVAVAADDSGKGTSRIDSTEEGTAGATGDLAQFSILFYVFLVLRQREQELYRLHVT